MFFGVKIVVKNFKVVFKVKNVSRFLRDLLENRKVVRFVGNFNVAV